MFLLLVFCFGDVALVLANDCVCLRKEIQSSPYPVFLSQTTDGSSRYLLADQTGIIYSYTSSWTKVEKPFLNISSLVKFDKNDPDDYESGLLGFALHRQFNSNKRYYVYYVGQLNGKRYVFVSEFTERSGGTDDIRTESSLIAVEQPSSKRNGGGILFGSDGYLYISIGDGGIAGNTGNEQMANQAQSGNSFLGKILRIDVDRKNVVNNRMQMYAVPDDNPFINDTDLLPEIYAYGCRNMFRCSFDMGSPEKLFCADTGNDDMEEVNIIRKGRNYGWNFREGTLCLIPGYCNNVTDEDLPIYTYNQTMSHSAALGGYVYRGTAFTGMVGQYVFGDHTGGLKRLVNNRNNNTWTGHDIKVCPSSSCPCNARESLGSYLRSFSQDKQGELYVLTTNFEIGKPTSRILKIVSPRESVQSCNGSSDIKKYIPAALWSLLIALLIWR